jgi:DNA polymerase-3 subunit gamma/tau
VTALFDTPEDAATQTPAYRVLARKYRPSRFEELIGQEAMVRTLANAIQTGRLPQAWMLTGVRGIGKTTTARLIARALNCTGADGKGGPTITPCGVCDACKAIAEDRHVDVQEMDAASRTSVDDIREIVDSVRYGPVAARYKLYILDEVHMLSKNAFNALLKTLEEPPPHTKFIFATTEIRKVPVTVLSRCQRFDLRRIESGELARHFAHIAELENVKAEDEAIRLIAHAADGSVRDGLSLLDQAIARANGGQDGASIKTEDVKDMLGLADRGLSLDLCRNLMKGEARATLQGFDVMMQAGADPLQVLQDLAAAIHLLTRGQIISDLAASADLPEGERKLLGDLASIKLPALTRAWQILLKGIAETQSAAHPDQAAEMVLIRMAYAAELPPPGDLIRALKDQMGKDQTNSKHATSPPAPTGSEATSSFPPPLAGGVGGGVYKESTARMPRPAPLESVAPQEALGPQPAAFREAVALFAENREGTLYGHLYNYAHPVRFAPGLLEIHVEAGAPENLAPRVAQCLSQWTGRRWMVTLAREAGGPSLAEEDKKLEEARHERAEAHPLMQAVMKSFPGAKLVALKQKTVAVEAALRDDEALSVEAGDDDPKTED